jgi:DNA polymerase-4
MRAILHVDMDAFYASVEEHDRPELKGKPVIVGGTSGRGVVAAANYAVRRFGVRSAMPIREALRRCPEAICIRPRMSRYQAVSAQVFEIFREFTPLVEGLSLDEAFLDVTASRRLRGEPRHIAIEIRRQILARTGLTASVGIAPNKLLAKIASDLHKPDGLFEIDAHNLRAVLDPLPIQKLFGVGQRSLPAVQLAGVRTFADLRTANAATLWRAFGKHGAAMRDRAAGLDERPVIADREEKSIGAEQTFAADLEDGAQLRSELLALTDRTAARLRGQNLVAGRLTVKIRRADFRTFTRQRAVEPATQETAVLCAIAQSLFDAWQVGQPGKAVRLLGVAVGDLQTLRQPDLFAAGPPASSRLDTAVDDIRRRFGPDLLTRASRMRGTGDAVRARRGSVRSSS